MKPDLYPQYVSALQARQ